MNLCEHQKRLDKEFWLFGDEVGQFNATAENTEQRITFSLDE